ncbi:ABC transporter permease subunit [Alteribacter aurantiacus]|uniref:ABC transporter permease subunit n=1 Tax=Alteribacter aurantiacus TaxID=254410 RepID=UPI000421384E|nr:ABC transporter permease subunit [Alteribacter aurantiacus]
MFHKALWIQNYKQSKMLIWILTIIFVIHLPFQTMIAIENWREYPHFYSATEYDIYRLFIGGSLPFFVLIATAILAGLLIGIERNTRRNDFTFSLPFKRGDMYLAKWIYGALSISVIHTVTFFTAYLILFTSEYAYRLQWFSLTELFLTPLIGYVLFFSFAMFIGTIAGEMISQVVLTFIFAIFPFGLFVLLGYGFDLHFRFNWEPPEWILYAAPLLFPFLNQQDQSLVNPLLVALPWTIATLAIGYFLYQRNKVEHNGEFLLFKQLQPVFLVGIVVCFALLGGMLISAIVPWGMTDLQVIAYWIGFLVFALFSYLLSRRLLSMNVTVKNK